MNVSLPVVFECKDTTEKIDFFEHYGLYIKPIARLNITIQLPPAKNPGQVVSNAEIIEKIKKQALPDEFIYLRVIKATFEFIRCEGEIENKSSFKILLSKLDGCSIKMNSFTDVLKVRAAESKIVYPTRHDWDSFFKDTQNPLNDLKPGERPDTIHLADLPVKWFIDRKITSDLDSFNNNSTSNKPSVNFLRDIFSIFGEIRMVDIPPHIKKPDLALSSSSLNFSTFEAYIQYKDYISFVKAMDTFRGMKLSYIEESGNAYTANIRVDFDRTRHLSDTEIKKREIDKLKNIEIEKIRNAQMEKEKDKEAKQKEIANFRMQLEESMDQEENNILNPDGAKDSNFEQKSKEQRRREREEARRQKRLSKKQQEEEKKFEMKIALEERKILIAQRKLESMRLLEELFNRVKVIVAQDEHEKRLKDLKEAEKRREREEANQEQTKKIRLEQEEQELQEKIKKNLKNQNDSMEDTHEEEFELRKTIIPKLEQNETAHSPADSKVPMPRALILSQQHLQKPQLYDDDVEKNQEETNNDEDEDKSQEQEDYPQEGEVDHQNIEEDREEPEGEEQQQDDNESNNNKSNESSFNKSDEIKNDSNFNNSETNE